MLFGGYDGGNFHNEAYLLDMESWVGSYPVMFVVQWDSCSFFNPIMTCIVMHVDYSGY